ncbi:hypothetical protein H5203_18830 [Pseudoalteromonas sp. SG41-1]|uniref:hypothetical protein n=1 Tax=Pseudoalteromonas sp. SG41-1 TaxID=2760979 RepID=UPI00160238B8|nr:hypothetical protein [Pseudoalteromonas sp. SG41-1]MBB1507524.1 hypothetical protein [Pseudoalteromonas sp. SG41-1]
MKYSVYEITHADTLSTVLTKTSEISADTDYYSFILNNYLMKLRELIRSNKEYEVLRYLVFKDNLKQLNLFEHIASCELVYALLSNVYSIAAEKPLLILPNDQIESSKDTIVIHECVDMNGEPMGEVLNDNPTLFDSLMRKAIEQGDIVFKPNYQFDPCIKYTASNLFKLGLNLH